MSAPDDPPGLPRPRLSAIDAIWLIVVLSLCLVLLWAVRVIALDHPEKLDGIFMAAVSFLAGLLSPSPVSK